MPLDTILSLISFAFVTSITPGPNNIMLTASGVNFGFRRSIPHMLGIAYMLFLAWRVATAGALGGGEDQARARPMTFLEAAAFQWVNPKGLIMAIGAMSVFPRPGQAGDILLVTLIFGLVNLPSVGTWAGFGAGLRNVLREPAKVRIFNIAMAVLLVASILPMVMAGENAA